MSLLQQVHSQGSGVTDGGTIRRCAAIERAALGEEVEGTFGHVHLQSWNVFGQAYNEVTTTFKGLPHLLHTLLALLIGGLGSLLVCGTMDDVKYRYEYGKNDLTIIKKL